MHLMGLSFPEEDARDLGILAHLADEIAHLVS